MDRISQSSVQRTYRFYAPLYDRLFGSILAPGRREVARVVHHQKPESLLEVGVGTGLSLSLYPSRTQITGVDLCPEMLAHAQRRVDSLAGRSISLHALDAECMPFADDSFDCVVACYVLSVTPDVDRLVHELQRVCRKGGTIVILNHFSGSRAWWLLERIVRPIATRIGFRSDFSYDEQITSRFGKVESVRTVNFLGLSKIVTVRNV